MARAPSSEWHRVLSVNPARRVGTCSRCGPRVPVKRRGRGGWRCLAAARDLRDPEKDRQRAKASARRARRRALLVGAAAVDRVTAAEVAALLRVPLVQAETTKRAMTREARRMRARAERLR